MHPVMIEMVAAERGRDLQARAVAVRRTREIRSRPARRTRPRLRIPRVWRGPKAQPAPSPLRGPRPA